MPRGEKSDAGTPLPATGATRAGLTARIPVTDITPVVDCGLRPAAGVVGEAIPVEATCFKEGHDILGVELVTRDPGGTTRVVRMVPTGEPHRYRADFRPNAMGEWSFTIRAWVDEWTTWLHRAEVKVPAGLDVELELEEGALLLDRAAPSPVLQSAARTMRSTALPIPVRLAAATDPSVRALLHEDPLREHVSDVGPWPVLAQRRRALVGSWYEFFPRSEGAVGSTSGTFATAARRLHGIAEMGFDVVYLPPIHPIGRSHRKGPNNSLTASASDPGSPWAIGSPDGGHDAVHPDLGTLADFDAFVRKAHDLDLEIALDLALQASPDHPWVTEHPEWFTTRADGSIAYAENPPKKYQDIYPLNFDNDPEGLYAEVERIVRHWMTHGVRIFRVDNPHTKPLWVWDRLIHSINSTDPDVLFLAEAFTSPPMMHALAKVGFQQSYTYFTWRNSSQEVREYLTELAGPSSAFMRPNFFANTPDILHEYLQNGGPAAFAIRATLAATLSPTYGIYSGFELYEHVAVRPGSEEYLDSEKYQLRPRDWEKAFLQGRTLAPYITLLNTLRRENPALQDLRSLHFHHVDNPEIIAFSKRDGDNIIAVVCVVDPHREHSGTVWWDMHALGVTDRFVARDLVSGHAWTWGPSTYVRLNPWESVAHIVSLSPTDAS